MVLEGLGLDSLTTSRSGVSVAPLAFQEFHCVVHVFRHTNLYGIVDTDVERNPEQERIADAVNIPYSLINGHRDEIKLLDSKLFRFSEQDNDVNAHTGVTRLRAPFVLHSNFFSFCSLTLLKTRT